MLGLGWTEMLVIGVVALIVIGPKDMPVVMGRIGKFVGQIRRMGNEFQREINRTTGLDEVRNLRNSITSPLKKTAEEIRKEFNTMTPSGPQPSGAIKPADPKVESVVDELRSAAGMPPAEKKSSTELAADYGFKASEPVKAAQVKAAKPAKAAPTAPVTTTDLPPVEPVKAAKPAAARKTAPAAAKTASTKKAAAPKAAVAAEVVAPAKPARKPRAKAAPVEVAAEPAAPVKKPRAPRKKPTDSAETK